MQISMLYDTTPNNPQTNYRKVPKKVRVAKKSGPVTIIKIARLSQEERESMGAFIANGGASSQYKR